MYGFKGLKIWVDDLRPAPEGYEWCKNFRSAIATIICFALYEGGIDILDLDHDLGDGQSGYDIAKYLVENDINIGTIRVHSMNPVGKKNIEQLLTRYHYHVEI